MQMLTPYTEYLKLIRDGKIDPEDIDVNLLISEFKNKIKELDSHKLYPVSGLFIEAVSKLVKLKSDSLLDVFIPESDSQFNERKKYLKKKIEDILKEYDLLEDYTLAQLFISYKRKTGRKKGSNPIHLEKISYEQFKNDCPFDPNKVLFTNTDYNAYAAVIAEKIKNGTFSINSFKDFIGLMFAIYLFNIYVTQEEVNRFLRIGDRNV